MKKVFKALGLTTATCIAFFLFISCGGGSDSIVKNEHLGDLPGIAKNYLDKIDAKKKELKENTDRDKAFKLAKEVELLDDEAENMVKEYLTSNPITKVPFAMEFEYPFTINELSVLKSSDSRIEFKAKITMTKDVPKRLFAYIKAIDKEGNQLTKKNGVMGEITFKKRSFKANEEIELSGSVDGPADLVNFDKLLFVSKEVYEKRK